MWGPLNTCEKVSASLAGFNCKAGSKIKEVETFINEWLKIKKYQNPEAIPVFHDHEDMFRFQVGRMISKKNRIKVMTGPGLFD